MKMPRSKLPEDLDIECGQPPQADEEEEDDNIDEGEWEGQRRSAELGGEEEEGEESANLLRCSSSEPDGSYSCRNTPIIVQSSTNSSTFQLPHHRHNNNNHNQRNGKKRVELCNSLVSRSAGHSPVTTPSTSSSLQDNDASSNNIKRNDGILSGISLIHGHTQTMTSMDSSKYRGVPRGPGKYGRGRKRVVFKNGEINLRQLNISKRRRRYLADIFFTLVDVQWRYTTFVFIMSFILSWLAFSLIWWLIAFTHGDLEFGHLPDQQEESGWKPCVANIWGFTSSFLFSIETQHTIGYGFRYTTEECPLAIAVMCIQSTLGVMIQALMVGVVFAKMSRPKKRTQTLMFSRHGVICQRDGELVLKFRIGDMRQSHIICANIRAQLIKRRYTTEGEELPYYQYELKVGVDSDQSNVFFIWPMIVVHKIDKESPLYAISAEEMIKERFEIVLILEGVIETNGSTTQARTSYLPSEILWGHRFEPLVSFKKEYGQYAIDYGLFNNTYEVDTPLCSAKDLDELKAIKNEMRRQGIQILPYQFPSTTQQQN